MNEVKREELKIPHRSVFEGWTSEWITYEKQNVGSFHEMEGNSAFNLGNFTLYKKLNRKIGYPIKGRAIKVRITIDLLKEQPELPKEII